MEANGEPGSNLSARLDFEESKVYCNSKGHSVLKIINIGFPLLKKFILFGKLELNFMIGVKEDEPYKK